jgi:hypothetical protein
MSLGIGYSMKMPSNTYQARAVNKKKGFTPEKILFRFNVQRTCAPA